MANRTRDTACFSFVWLNPPRTTTKVQWYHAQHWLRFLRRRIAHEVKAIVDKDLERLVCGR